MTLPGESFFFNSDSGGGVVKLDAGLARVLPCGQHRIYYYIIIDYIIMDDIIMVWTKR